MILILSLMAFFFFFQAEDGIRVIGVTGVQTCALPIFTLSGPCDILFFEGVPGGPLDCWQDRPGAAEHFTRTLDLMRTYVPWEFDRCGAVELTDDKATLTGGYTPVVRQPVGALPAGGR